MIGVPDAKWGERVHAVVILHDGAATSGEEPRRLVPDPIAGYKRPQSVAIIARGRNAENRDRKDPAPAAAAAVRGSSGLTGQRRPARAATNRARRAAPRPLKLAAAAG